MAETLIERLLNMRTSEFSAYVRDNVGNEDPGIWEALLSPQLVHTTRDTLTDINIDIEAQFGQRNAQLDAFQGDRNGYFAAKNEHDEWKRKAMGFKRIVRRRLAEARQATVAANQQNAAHRTTPKGSTTQPNVVKIQHNVRSLFRLAWAVLQHREACLEADIVPEPHDIQLWEHLDTLPSYSAELGERPLIEWLEGAMAKPGFIPPEER